MPEKVMHNCRIQHKCRHKVARLYIVATINTGLKEKHYLWARPCLLRLKGRISKLPNISTVIAFNFASIYSTITSVLRMWQTWIHLPTPSQSELVQTKACGVKGHRLLQSVIPRNTKSFYNHRVQKAWKLQVFDSLRTFLWNTTTHPQRQHIRHQASAQALLWTEECGNRTILSTSERLPLGLW